MDSNIIHQQETKDPQAASSLVISYQNSLPHTMAFLNQKFKLSTTRRLPLSDLLDTQT
jgi:hypothetical protein